MIECIAQHPYADFILTEQYYWDKEKEVGSGVIIDYIQIITGKKISSEGRFAKWEKFKK